MPEFTTYNYIGNSSGPLRLESASVRPSRVVESRYTSPSVNDQSLAYSAAGQFQFNVPPISRFITGVHAIEYIDTDLEQGNFSPNSPSFGFLRAGRVVERAYDAYDSTVVTGGVPDPVESPDDVEVFDWGNLGATSVTEDWGTLGTTDIEFNWGII